MSYHPYNLDHKAQDLVLEYRDRDVLKESHKMRTTVAYGLERFWGEHLRLLGKSKTEDKNKGEYWRAVWTALAKILAKANITVPNDEINAENINTETGTRQIKQMARKLWGCDENFPFPERDRKIALAVLTQLCDSLVWWTQRYQKAKERDTNN